MNNAPTMVRNAFAPAKNGPMATWDLVVIGAGVLGTFHALFAAQQGWRTLLIERGELPREASVRNFGLIIPSAQAPDV